MRAGSDAILIGATTLRRDNPRLIVKSRQRQAERETRELPGCPLKVVTASGDLSPELRFFHSAGDRLIYCPEAVAPKLRDRIGDLAEVASVGASLDFGAMVDDLGERGVRQHMVAGGSTIHTQVLTVDLADEIHLAVVPFFVGDADAPRFELPGNFPQGNSRRMHLAELRQIGDIALLRYLPRKPAAAAN